MKENYGEKIETTKYTYVQDEEAFNIFIFPNRKLIINKKSL